MWDRGDRGLTGHADVSERLRGLGKVVLAVLLVAAQHQRQAGSDVVRLLRPLRRGEVGSDLGCGDGTLMRRSREVEGRSREVEGRSAEI